MDDLFSRSILEETAAAYACFRILSGAGGDPADAVCLESSHTSARFFGLRPSALVGHRASEVLPAFFAEQDDWLMRFAEVARTGRPADYDADTPLTALPCRVHVFSPGRGYFTLLFQARSLSRTTGPEPTAFSAATLAAFLDEWIGLDDIEQADPLIARAWLDLSGGRIAAFHRPLPDGTGYRTAAIAGLPTSALTALEALGAHVEGHVWPWGPAGSTVLPVHGSAVFPDASALAASLLPAHLAEAATGWGAGEAVLTGIPGSSPGTPQAFVTLLMPPGQPFTAHEACEVLAGIVSVWLSAREASLPAPDDAQISREAAGGKEDTMPEAAELVFEHSPCALFLLDVLDENRPRYVKANPAALNGALVPDPAGLSPQEVFGPERGARIATHVSRCVREAEMVWFEDPVDLPDGQHVLRTVLSPLVENGRVVQVFGAAGDVTEHRKTEAALRGHLRRSEVLLDLLHDTPRDPDRFLSRLADSALGLTGSPAGGVLLPGSVAGTWQCGICRGTWAETHAAYLSLPPVQPAPGTPWAEAIRTGRPAIRNTRSSAASPEEQGGAPGFPVADTMMCVPVFDIGRIVAVLGVAGRADDYSEEQAFQLRILANSAWPTIGRLRAEADLILERDLLHATLLSIGDAVIASGGDGKVTLMNDAACQLTGWTREQAVGQLLEDVLPLIDEHTREPYIPSVDHTQEPSDAPLHGSLLLLSKDAGEHPVALNVSPIRDARSGAAGVVVSVRDVTLARHHQESITYLSYHDQLTGLYNRRFFEEELRRLDTKRNLPITLVMADVNALKLTNDAFGHKTGDRLLCAAADVLRVCCREDDIIARLSGDEFVILLPHTGSDKAAEIVDRIRELCDKTHVDAVALSVSFGWESKSEEDEDIQDTFKRAEDHMYRQKLFESPVIRSNTIQTIIQTLYKAQPREESRAKHVAALCEMMGRALGLPDHIVKELRTASAFYDIGKIAIRDDILGKHGDLTEEERREMRRHAEIGYRIVSSVNELAEIANFILLHHERWDGTGYPKGLTGDKTPLPSRIIGLADAYDAMVNHRPYRAALSPEEAVRIIREEAGTKFDPHLVEIFVKQVAAEMAVSQAARAPTEEMS